MLVVVIFSLLALLFTYLESRHQMKGGMKLGFILVTILGAIHYDYGNDYMNYFNLYKEITKYKFDLNSILDGIHYDEVGWVLLCWLFKPIGGFFMMVAVLNIIQNIIVYKFIKRYVMTKWWPMAIFIYLFKTSFYLLSFSMMRQELVIIIFLGLWPLIEQRKWLLSLLIIYLCSYLHSSAMILLPFTLWGFFPSNKGKLIIICYIFLLLILWLLNGVLNNIFQTVLSFNDSFSRNADYYDNGKRGLQLGLGFIINIIPCILSIKAFFPKEKEISNSEKKIIALYVISFLVVPFVQIISLVSRIQMYFEVYSIGAIPIIYNNIRNITLKISLIIIYLLITLYEYFRFFQDPVWVEKYSHFQTIFSQL